MCCYAGSQTNHLTQAIDYAEVAVLVVGDYHMEAVGPEIDCSEELRARGIVTHCTKPIPQSLTIESLCIPPLLQ